MNNNNDIVINPLTDVFTPESINYDIPKPSKMAAPMEVGSSADFDKFLADAGRYVAIFRLEPTRQFLWPIIPLTSHLTKLCL